MSLLKPPQEIPKAERTYNEYKSRRRSLINLSLAFVSLTAIGVFLWPGVLYACGFWGLIRLFRTVRFFMWKDENKVLLEEGEKLLRQKEKKAAREAERVARIRAISGELPPDELFKAVEKQADYATKAVKALPYDGTQLIAIIEHNVSEINKITNYLIKLEEYIEEENPTLLGREKEAVINQLKTTADQMVRNQLSASLELLEQRIAESHELLLEEKRLRSKITTFQQAIESIRTKATRLEATLIDGDNPEASEAQTAKALATMEQEFELMRKVQAEIDEVTLSETNLQAELKKLRENSQAARKAKAAESAAF